MREVNVDFTETFENKTYQDEQILTKRIFQKVKEDLVRQPKNNDILFYIIFLLDV